MAWQVWLSVRPARPAQTLVMVTKGEENVYAVNHDQYMLQIQNGIHTHLSGLRRTLGRCWLCSDPKQGRVKEHGI
jgi:hypothetical protein